MHLIYQFLCENIAYCFQEMRQTKSNEVENGVIHNSDLEDNSDDESTAEAFQLIGEALDSEKKTIGDTIELTNANLNYPNVVLLLVNMMIPIRAMWALYQVY
jgi:hypothetical protein